MEKKDEKSNIILHFIYIKEQEAKLNQFFDLVKFENAKINGNFNDSNDILINISLDDNIIYYNEMINLYYNKNSKFPDISFQYPIYKNKINNIYIDNINKKSKTIKENNNKINDSNEDIHKLDDIYDDWDSDDNNAMKNSINPTKLISVEIIFQTIKNELLPNKIVYDNKELTCFDYFKNKLRQRIGLVNIDPDKLAFINEIYDDYPNFKFINSTFYQIFARIPLEGNIRYSIDKLEYNSNKLNKKKFSIEIDKKKSINELLKFRNNFFAFIEKSIKEKLDDNQIKELTTQSNSLDFEYNYYDNILSYNNYDNKDLDIFILMFYYLEFIEIIKLKDKKIIKKNEFMGKISSLIELNQTYDKYISLVKEYDININDKILIIKAYNKKFINSLISGDNINYITTINIEKENKINPYCKAIDFIKNIILNLKEESRMFEIFLYLDSNVISNLLVNKDESLIKSDDILNNKKKENVGNNPTEYGINMSNIDEVRNHLYKLIPKYIIRIDSELKFNANYDPNSKIMTLNEKKLFNNNSISLNRIFEKDEENECYVLPIIIEILHEIFAHGKKRLINDKENTPEEYRDSKYNYDRKKIQKKIKISDFNYKKVDYTESGIVLENYISENRRILRWMRKIHDNNEDKQIMKVELWVDKDFNKLEKLIENFIQLEKDENLGESIYDTTYSNDEDFIDSDFETCGFHNPKYNYSK